MDKTKLLRLYRKAYKKVERNPLLFTVLLSFFMAVVLYQGHIVESIPLFMTQYDGFGQAWPFRVAMADYIRTYGFIPQWHFGIGLGGTYPPRYLSPFDIIPTIMGRELLPSVMVWLQVAKIVTACLFFFLYLKKLGFHPLACSMVSLLYSLSGHMILRGGNWVAYGTEVALVAFLLYAVEVYFTDKKWYLTPLAVFLMGISFSAYMLYLYALLLFSYATARYLYDHAFELKEYLLRMLKCGLLFLVGSLFSAFNWFPTFMSMLNAARGETAISEISLGMARWIDVSSHRFLLSAFMRFFSSDVLGIGEEYSGWGNLLEGPLNYAGITAVVLIPLFFYYANKKLRIFAAVGLSFSVLYFISPMFLLFMNGFIGDTLKLSSFWITFLLLLMLAYTFEKLIQSPKISDKFIFVSGALSVALFIGATIMSANSNLTVVYSIVVAVVALMVLYFVTIYFYGKHRSRSFLAVLCILIIAEAFAFSGITTNYFFRMARGFYFNYQEHMMLLQRGEVMNALNAEDPGFFRTAKRARRSPLSMSQAMVANYFGSSYYSSLISHAYLDFSRAVDAPLLMTGRQAWGLHDRFMLQTLTAHKYHIPRNNSEVPFGHEHLFTIGDQSVYKNLYYLPLGFAYDSFITRAQFDTLVTPAKQDIAFLSAAVLNEPDHTLNPFDIYELKDLMYIPRQSVEIPDLDEIRFHQLENVQNNLPKRLTATATDNDPFMVIPIRSKEKDMHFAISVDITSDVDTIAQFFWDVDGTGFSEGYSRRYRVTGGETTAIELTIYNADLTALRIDPGEAAGEYVIENLVITALTPPPTYELYAKAVHARREESFVIDYFRHNRIIGKIETFGNRVLFFSIPHAPGWRLYINGERTEIETVNIGFIGATVGEGVHHIELRYRLPGLLVGSAMSAAGLVAYVVLVVLDKKKIFKIEP
ncbi:MAG: YfhO family protein [Defluviitaleaceae bacterium]|nr:YfhO family protein [Defluviitaleaceae bacterium]MCL2263556.1 YfhO family protein [Defluviitaleaceae bacterium]